MMTQRWYVLCLLLFLLPAQAETVYVNDTLRVSVRAQPGSSGATVSVLSSGTALEVLERQPGYLRVRAGSVEGWISEGFVTTEMPPRQRLMQLEKAHAQVQAELEQLRATTGTNTDQASALTAQLATLQTENTKLKEDNASLSAQLQANSDNLLWIYVAAGLLAVFLLGHYLGTHRYRQRVKQRFGGLDV